MSNLSKVNWTDFCVELEGLHDEEEYVIWLIYAILQPVLLLLGTFGNVMIFLVIGHVCAGTTTSAHFRNRAVFDTAAAYFTVIPLFLQHAFNIPVLQSSRVSCALLTVLRYITGDVAIWLVLVISLDRLVAVWKPLKVRHCCPPSIANRILSVLLCLAVVKDGHILIARGLAAKESDPCDDNSSIQYDCTTLDQLPGLLFYETQIRPVIATICVSIIPVGGAVVCNCVITTMICKHSKAWLRTMTMESVSVDALSRVGQSSQSQNSESEVYRNLPRKSIMQQRMQKTERNSLILTLTNSSAFFIFVIPSFVLCLMRHELPLPFIVSDSVRENMLLAVTDSLIVCNFTLNYYLCCAASKSFRHKVRHYLIAKRSRTNSSS